MIFVIPPMFLWINFEPIFLAVGQPADVAYLASRFLRIWMLVIPAIIGRQICGTFLMCQ